MCPDVPKNGTGGTGVPGPFRPHGWDKFFGMCPDDCYEDCLFVEVSLHISLSFDILFPDSPEHSSRDVHEQDGIGHRFNDPSFVNGTNYATSVIGNTSTRWLKEQLEAQAGSATAPPFFAYIAPHAPHTSPRGQSMVAPWYLLRAICRMRCRTAICLRWDPVLRDASFPGVGTKTRSLASRRLGPSPTGLPLRITTGSCVQPGHSSSLQHHFESASA